MYKYTGLKRTRKRFNIFKLKYEFIREAQTITYSWYSMGYGHSEVFEEISWVRE